MGYGATNKQTNSHLNFAPSETRHTSALKHVNAWKLIHFYLLLLEANSWHDSSTSLHSWLTPRAPMRKASTCRHNVEATCSLMVSVRASAGLITAPFSPQCTKLFITASFLLFSMQYDANFCEKTNRGRFCLPQCHVHRSYYHIPHPAHPLLEGEELHKRGKSYMENDNLGILCSASHCIVMHMIRQSLHVYCLYLLGHR